MLIARRWKWITFFILFTKWHISFYILVFTRETHSKKIWYRVLGLHVQRSELRGFHAETWKNVSSTSKYIKILFGPKKSACIYILRWLVKAFKDWSCCLNLTSTATTTWETEYAKYIFMYIILTVTLNTRGLRSSRQYFFRPAEKSQYIFLLWFIYSCSTFFTLRFCFHLCGVYMDDCLQVIYLFVNTNSNCRQMTIDICHFQSHFRCGSGQRTRFHAVLVHEARCLSFWSN